MGKGISIWPCISAGAALLCSSWDLTVTQLGGEGREVGRGELQEPGKREWREGVGWAGVPGTAGYQGFLIQAVCAFFPPA